ncbi:hypothetical protein [Kluyvera genomosp. 3]|uniref:Uncharacterized protein n=1 Tax=Kluyvera genomosp. 3 TaxID=2774055 RepID=A0A6G9RKA0_9ENTR|nr:hypothetical protein [Kluyvera genomosp. 3]QIR26695.1 hypothetical protein GY169_07630 [Kluyvera genomosp. 3]
MTIDDLPLCDQRIQEILKAFSATRSEFKERHPTLLRFMDLHDFRLTVEGTTDLNLYEITLYVKSEPSMNLVFTVNYNELNNLQKFLQLRFQMADEFFKEHASESQRQVFLYDEITEF